jgi:nucleotide-binding universal stress UspA family protein
MFKRILVPTDGSELSASAIKAAASLAKNLNANLIAVHVMPVFAAMVYPEAVMYSAISLDDFNAETEQEANKALAAATQEAQRAGVSCETVKNRFDQPFLGILDAAKRNDCDLIVMASHGRRGVKALVLGSETHKLLTHSKIPVLVYR